MEVRLFERIPSGMIATDAGREIALAAERMEEAVIAVDSALTARDRTLEGTLKVSAPQLLLERFLGPAFAEFRAAYPALDLVVDASNEPVNLYRREADLAVRIVDAPQETLFGRRLTQQRRGLYASHGYLNDRPDIVAGKPTQPVDWVAFAWWDETVPSPSGWTPAGARIQARFDDMIALQGAVRAGLGVARMPCFVGGSDPLLRLVPGTRPERYADIWVLTHPDLRQVTRVRAMMQHLSGVFTSHAALFEGVESKIG